MVFKALYGPDLRIFLTIVGISWGFVNFSHLALYMSEGGGLLIDFGSIDYWLEPR